MADELHISGEMILEILYVKKEEDLLKDST
jgi:hypothetical protein